MLRRLLHVRTVLAAGALAGLPGLALAQVPAARPVDSIPLFTPTPLDEKQVKAWARDLVARIDDTWTEVKPAVREQRLLRLADSTPSELAFLTRVLRRNEGTLSTVAIASLKDVFAVLRNTAWENADAAHVQKIVAGWSVMIPELIKKLGDDASTTEIRRTAEAALVDLATLGRDERLGSPPARQAWQAQNQVLAGLTRHPKASVRLAALHILEARGRDASAASAAVIKALGDPDRFVRWSAVQTLQTMGLDDAALRAVATLQKDEDPDVREAAVAAVLAQPGGTDVLALTKNASPIRNTSLIQPAVSKRLQAVPPPILPPPILPPRAPETKVSQAQPAVKAPEKLPELRPAVPANLAPKPPEKPKADVVKVEATQSAPATTSAATGQAKPLRHVFTSSTPTAETVAPRPASTSVPPPAPALPRTVNATTKPAPALTLPVPPAQALTPPAPPRNIATSPQSMPLLFSPPPPPAAKAPDIRPVSASTPAVKIDMADLWLKKLTGPPADQVMALRQLGKLKQGAAHCVPQMAELLIKGDVTVRREVPLALQQIGGPARIATSLLERALNDSDTQVKVNAARCLVELAAK